MLLPEFNKYGVLPEGIHLCSIDEAGKRFGEINDFRKKSWNKFLEYFKKLEKSEIAHYIIIDGSFVTDKMKPGDIDVMISLNVKNLSNLNDKLRKELLDRVYTVLVYNIEVFPHIDNNPKFKNDLSEYFQYVKPKSVQDRGMTSPSNPNKQYYKGVIRVDL